MRMVNNESLEPRQIMDVLKDPIEVFTYCFDPNYDGDEDGFKDVDPEGNFSSVEAMTLYTA